MYQLQVVSNLKHTVNTQKANGQQAAFICLHIPHPHPLQFSGMGGDVVSPWACWWHRIWHLQLIEEPVDYTEPENSENTEPKVSSVGLGSCIIPSKYTDSE